MRPTALLRRCHARYGEPFTLQIGWADAPMVFITDPADIKRVFAADSSVLRAGASSTVLEPFAGPRSILLLDGAEHLRQRRLMLPPFHGEALAALARHDRAARGGRAGLAGSPARRCARTGACTGSRSR